MIRRFAFILALPLAACATEEAITTCDPGVVCGDDGGGKADSPSRRIEVSVDECGPGGLCPYVQSASCGLVTLHDKTGKVVAKAFSSDGGRVTFANIANGEYTVKVHKANGTLAQMFVSDYTDELATAKLELEVTGSGGAQWARFNLPNGSADELTQCAAVRGNVTVTDSRGTPLDRHDAEWNWFVELERDGNVLDISRLLFIYPDSNVVSFRLLPKGTSTIRFIRMDIPSYLQKPNPDYARLRRLYATDEAPIELDVSVTSNQFGKELDVSREIVDPLAQ
jgi:hypothetical protein